MRCLSCNKRLNNRESTRKYASSGTFIDLCDHCFGTVSADIPEVEGDGGFEDVEVDTDTEVDLGEYQPNFANNREDWE